MDNAELIGKIQELQQQIEQLNAQAKPTSRPKNLNSILQQVLSFLVANWVLLSFLIALVSAVIIWAGFGIDPFETDRNIQTTNTLSEFYREMGDQYFDRGDYALAQDAYQQAVTRNPDNAAATYGIAKAQVLQPPDGEQFVSPSIVSAEVAYLLAHIPNDYQTDFLNGIQFYYQKDIDDAKTWLQRASAEHPTIDSYMALAQIDAEHNDMREAAQYFQSAVDLDPHDSNALDNLAGVEMLLGEFGEAASDLTKADGEMPTLDIELALGNCYMYLGDYVDALQAHQFALRRLSEPGFESQATYATGTYQYNYMPLKPGDTQTTSQYIDVYDLQEKQTLLHYALSFDYALSGDASHANSEFTTARQLDSYDDYGNFISNEIQSIEGFLTPDAQTTNWFDQHSALLGTQ